MNADLGFFVMTKRFSKTPQQLQQQGCLSTLKRVLRDKAYVACASLPRYANPSATVFELQSVSPGQVWTTSACLVPTMAQWVGGNHSGHVRGVFFSGTCLRLRPHSCLPKQLRSRRNPKDLQRQGFLNPPEF